MRLKCFVAAALVLALAGGLGVLIFIYSGVFNVAADHPHYALERWLFTTVREHSVAARVENIEVPENLDDPARVASGITSYESMCAPCHLRPGMPPTPLHRGLNPKPPELAEWSADPATTFWIVSHGIRSTGMPAWGRTHEDAALWDVVAFLRQLPDLTATQYEAMLREQRDAQEHDHEHGKEEPAGRGTPGGPNR